MIVNLKKYVFVRKPFQNGSCGLKHKQSFWNGFYIISGKMRKIKYIEENKKKSEHIGCVEGIEIENGKGMK